MSGSDDFSTLFELLPIGAYRSAPSGEQLRANPALVRLNGYSSERELLAAVKNIGDSWYVQDGRRDEFKKAMEEHGEVKGFVSEIYRHCTRERIWISENAHVVRDAAGNVAYYEGTIEDITYQRNAELALQRAVHRYEALTAKSQSVTLVCDVEGNVSYVSDSIRWLLGTTADEFVGRNLFDTMHEDDLVEHKNELRRVAIGKNTGEESVARHRHRDGSWRYLASLATDARNDEAIGGIVVYWRDVTETHLARVWLNEVADTDALTGLTNRACFERTARDILRQAGSENRPAVLYFIDLDDFKVANDSYGHIVGDRVLRFVAERIELTAPVGSLIGRFGGDEFAVLCTTNATRTEIHQFAHALIQAIAKTVHVEALEFDITASIGIALFPEHATDYTELLRFSDQAMYAAKALSRNTYCLFTPEFERKARARADLVVDLKRSLIAREITVYFQPQVNLRSGGLTGVEALARWQHPTKGLVSPGEFIALAEEQGLINQIGVQVLEQTMAQLALWRRNTGRSLRAAINVSARQLRDRTLLVRLYELLAEHQLPADTIEVEVTESVLLNASTAGRDFLEELRHLGVRVILDDLGVGYSSMAYLRQFSVDGVKIDRGFVQGLPGNAIDVAIVRALIGLARELNLTIVAEGVETEAQREFLLQSRCDIAQGYLLSPPISADEVERAGWLAR
jgi:diguanylate cyclase (GGDEF)-like protein/PAS domain S-box-containing protein